MPTLLRRLLWIDGLAALSAGVVTLAFAGFLSDLYALPPQLVTFMGGVNLIYAFYSSALATQRRRRLFFLVFLAFANAAWACVCAGFAVTFRDQASATGLGVLIFECVFVGALAWLEWRHRHALLQTA